jgi:hypothetical protein
MGCAVVNENNEVLYMSQPKLRDDIKTKMTRRRKLRRQRRRKLKYRRRGSKNRRTLVRKGEYQLYSDTAPYYRYRHEKVCGIKKGDKVKYFGKQYFLQKNPASGYCTLVNIYSEEQGFSHLPWGYKTPQITKLKRAQARSTTLCVSCKIF